MKADMKKLSELLEKGMKIQMPEISKIQRIGNISQIIEESMDKSKLCSKITLQEIKCLEMHHI